MDHSQQVKVNCVPSNWQAINGDVSPGTKLGPLLFLLMINDLVLYDAAIKNQHVMLPSHTVF